MSKKQEKEFTLKDAIAFVSEIQDKYSTGKYIFRGTNRVYSKTGKGYVYEYKIHDTIHSGLYHSIVYLQGTKYKNKRNGVFDDRPDSIIKAEEEVIKRAKYLFPSHTDTLPMLTDIQHFGGKTNLIDFSKDMYIALFFACNGELDKDGELLLLEKQGVESISQLVEYDSTHKLPELGLIEPPITSSSEVRVKVQRSVFVYSKKGYIPIEKLEEKIIPIPSEKKRILLRYLDNYLNITARTIYNDLIGFVENEKNNETAVLWLRKGDEKLDKGIEERAEIHYSGAIEDYDKALEINPEYTDAYNHRGNAKKEQGNYSGAIEDYDKALEIDPKYVAAYNNRGLAKAEQGNYSGAIEDYDKALEIDPKYVAAYNNRGLAKAEQGNYSGAIEDYDKALEIDPEYVAAYNNRGNAKMNQKDIAGAIEDYKKAIELDPNNSSVYNNRGLLKVKQGI